MIKYILTVTSILISLSSFGQDYFQQEVDYDIKVKLIDSIHTLEGDIKITYKNNSPDALSEIYMHLWGNAFKNRTTAFAKQKVRSFNTDFYYAEEEELGFYSNLDFKVNGNSVTWKLDEENIDIGKITLSQPLGPGETITISTPFSLRIPNSYSRLGHVETSYQMTQWFPKPAVYDRNGWHQMPYLDMGEFYSEFGDFNVEITLPENYYVGATGLLQNESEKAFLKERIKYTDQYLLDTLRDHSAYPASSMKMKTLKYTAERVHDFAWFADKRFLVQKDVATLSSGKDVDCWVFFTDLEKDLWKDGAFYVKRAVEFYSERVGDYPYPHATAVQSALSAGAGMEYPMITVIGRSVTAPALDQVITHEVGHNWFYGILASNERDFPWMDEGMNSYHDHKYTSIYYDDYDEAGGIMPKKIERQMEYSTLSLAYQVWARIGKDQAPNTTSNDLTTLNYFLGAYEKPAMAFKLLENYIGEEQLVTAMRKYYDEWKFRHPQPEDTKASFEHSTGLDLDWLFDGMLFSNQVYDYKVKSINLNEGTIEIENNGMVAAPINLTYYTDTAVGETVWYDGFLGSKKLPLVNKEVKIVELDKERISLDIKPSNNDYKIKGGAVGSKLKLRWLSGLTTSKTEKIFMLPIIGFNSADQLQVGIAFHNYGIPLSNFQYYIQPGVGSRDGSLIGSFEFRRDFPQRTGKLRNVSIALGGKSFHESYNERFDYSLRFTRIQPSIEFEWKDKLVSPIAHYVRYRPIGIVTENARIGRETGFEGKDRNLAIIHNAEYNYLRRSPIAPLDVKVNTEFQQYKRGDATKRYLKLYASADAKYAYKKGKFFEIRGFAGFFPLHTEGDISTSAAIGNFSMFSRGFNDYRYDQHFIDRNGQEGFFTRQVAIADGGFKNGITNSMPIGLSNKYLASINLAIDLPFGWSKMLPIKPYFDAGVYSYKATTSEPFQQEVLYSGGLMIDFQKTIMIHFPLFNSERITNIYEQTAANYWQRISFTIDINKLNPHGLKHWFLR
ncbi:M1 family metallopeptidase [Portibacter lacus]|uniref:Peptidase M1 membrane alanine aminopeptidase domain-containing protein n=1 Tax=Portibacter lacus TaxID=1099794 RepID=A0AA37SUT2_9BACT|nr:M1 family metallopeptidase [Portibacter lacus]GLR19251.1 hypothetical protein GCM10007940_38670 [Portibacter lacus]